MAASLTAYDLLKPCAIPALVSLPAVRLPGPLHEGGRIHDGLHSRHRLVCSTIFKEKEPLTQPVTQDVQPKPFDWNKCWYPVAVVDDLEPKRPTPVKLLDRDFVLWRDVNAEWRCFEDACPHRLAPLSEGRIEPSDGSLMCSYHGWRFQSDGECTRIPQAKDGGVSTGCKNPRSRAKAFPVTIKRGMLYVWPDDSPSAFIDSAANELKDLSFEIDDRYVTLPPDMKEQPMSFDVWLENTMDPGHAPFVHHGELVSRDAVRGLEAKKSEGASDDELKFEFTSYNLVNGSSTETRASKSTLTFYPPNHKIMTADYPGFCNSFLVVPVTSTTCRTFFQLTIPKTTPSLLARFYRSVLSSTWYAHWDNSRISDADQPILSGQDKNLRHRIKDGAGWDSKYFLPVSSDLAIVGFRRWLHGPVGGGGPKLSNGRPFLQGHYEERTRRSILDRYNIHTKHCRVCTGALRNFRILKSFSQAVCAGFAAYGLLLVQSLIDGSGVCLWKRVVCIVGLLLSAHASRKLAQMEESFFYAGFDHWKT